MRHNWAFSHPLDCCDTALFPVSWHKALLWWNTQPKGVISILSSNHDTVESEMELMLLPGELLWSYFVLTDSIAVRSCLDSSLLNTAGGVQLYGFSRRRRRAGRVNSRAMWYFAGTERLLWPDTPNIIKKFNLGKQRLAAESYSSCTSLSVDKTQPPPLSDNKKECFDSQRNTLR